MRLTLQTHFDGAWHHAATLELKDDAVGFQGASGLHRRSLLLEKQSVTIARCLCDIPLISKIDIAGAGRRSSWISCHRDM